MKEDLKEILGNNLAKILETALVNKGLRMCPVMSQFSSTQRNDIAKAIVPWPELRHWPLRVNRIDSLSSQEKHSNIFNISLVDRNTYLFYMLTYFLLYKCRIIVSLQTLSALRSSRTWPVELLWQKACATSLSWRGRWRVPTRRKRRFDFLRALKGFSRAY